MASNKGIDPTIVKYIIIAEIEVEGIVNKSDVVGAIFGQTEGLLDSNLELRELQRSGRIGRIEVSLRHEGGRSKGEIRIPSSISGLETAIIAAAIEEVERVGPCRAKIKVKDIVNIRVAKKKKIVERAKDLYLQMRQRSEHEIADIVDKVRELVRAGEIVYYGSERLPAGPDVEKSDTIIIVEGRNDVLNLLKNGFRNVIAVNGTNVPKTISDLSRQKIAIALVDGDRGGLSILRELLQVADLDYVAVAPYGWEVEQLSYKQIQKALRDKLSVKEIMKECQGKSVEECRELVIKKARALMEKFRKMEEEYWEEYVEQAEEKPVEEKAELKPLKVKEVTTPEALNFEELASSRMALLLDEEGKVIKEVPVRDVVNELGKLNGNVSQIIVGGSLTQRLLDLAVERGVRKIVALNMRGVVRVPKGVVVITKERG